MKKAGPSRATIKDVAVDAGVSIKTVSRVINKESNIRPETRKKVEAAIARLHYIPNMAARGLAGSHSFKLALLYDHTHDHVNFNYVIHLQNGVLDCCLSEGYDLLIHPCNFRSKSLAADIAEMARVTRLSGIILVPPLSDRRQLLNTLDKAGIRFATISSVHKARSVANVVCDDEVASYTMTRHLLSLGHRKIAFIKGHPDHGASEIRWQGFKRAMSESGFNVPEKFIVQGYFDYESGRAGAAKLLALRTPPTAIFACNDEMAAGVIHEGLKRNVVIPGQLSVTGFDDSIIARQTFPTLTTVRQPTRQMAHQAALLLVESCRSEQLSRVSKPRQLTLEHEIIIRNSTSSPE